MHGYNHPDSPLACSGNYLVDGNDLTVDLLDLLQLAQEVPEARLGNDLVRGEDAHAVQLGGGLLLGRELAANDLILVELRGADKVPKKSE